MSNAPRAEHFPKAKQFIIYGPPHLMMRLKRWFHGAKKSQLGQIEISDTDANARDLLMLVERYGIAVSGPCKLAIHVGARRYDERLAMLERILKPGYSPPVPHMAKPPREYQAQAAAVCRNQRFLLLADELGLGKTITGITTLASPEDLPGAVVCPAHLQSHWQNKLAEFVPNLATHIVKTLAPYEIDQTNQRPPDVLILTYPKLASWAEVLGGYIKTLIFDEGQELRKNKSAKYEAAKLIREKAKQCLILTATPIYNYGGEIFNVIDIASPGALGTWGEFDREWCGSSGDRDKASVIDSKAFGTYLREQGIMLRRTREEVGRELPPVVRTVHDVDSNPRAFADVQDRAGELARIILARSNADERGVQMRAAGELDALMRQATGLAKAPYVAAFVDLLAQSGEPIILCGWHRAVYDVWGEHLKHLRVGMYTGHESTNQKDAVRQRMIDRELDVLILSLRSGSGLDGLQNVCSTIVFGELDWAPGVHEQCIGRLQRDGQGVPVNAFFLISDDGSDPIMAGVLGLKREQAEGINNPDADLLEELSRDGGHITELAKMIADGKRPARKPPPPPPPPRVSPTPIKPVRRLVPRQTLNDILALNRGNQ